MYRVSVTGTFCAVHRLRLPDGTLEPTHGHDWKVRATFAGTQLDDAGMLVDFVEAERILKQILSELHHGDLNAAPMLSGANPSAELVARAIAGGMAAGMPRGDLLESVELEEAPGCFATYYCR